MSVNTDMEFSNAFTCRYFWSHKNLFHRCKPTYFNSAEFLNANKTRSLPMTINSTEKSLFRGKIKDRPNTYYENFAICFHIHIAHCPGNDSDCDIILLIY